MQTSVREQKRHSRDTASVGASHWPVVRRPFAALRCSAYCSYAAFSTAAGLQQPVAFQRRQFWPPDDRAAQHPPPLRKVVAGSAWSSVLKSNRTTCSSWMVGHLVVLLNTKAALVARLQRLAEISNDSFQLT